MSPQIGPGPENEPTVVSGQTSPGGPKPLDPAASSAGGPGVPVEASGPDSTLLDAFQPQVYSPGGDWDAYHSGGGCTALRLEVGNDSYYFMVTAQDDPSIPEAADSSSWMGLYDPDGQDVLNSIMFAGTAQDCAREGEEVKAFLQGLEAQGLVDLRAPRSIDAALLHTLPARGWKDAQSIVVEGGLGRSLLDMGPGENSGGLEWVREAAGLHAQTIGPDTFNVDVSRDELEMLIANRQKQAAPAQKLPLEPFQMKARDVDGVEILVKGEWRQVQDNEPYEDSRLIHLDKLGKVLLRPDDEVTVRIPQR